MPALKKSVDPRKQPVQKRGQDKVERILKSALQLLKRNHPNSITASLIAAKAGVNIATLYQFFPNKEAVFHALYQDWLHKISTAYDEVETTYFLESGWREFFTRMRQARVEVGYDPKIEANLDYLMEGSQELSKIDRFHAENLASRMTRYLRAYGSSWDADDLKHLSLLLYEIGWAATFRTVNQPAQRVAQVQDWTLQACLTLIENCLTGKIAKS